MSFLNFAISVTIVYILYYVIIYILERLKVSKTPYGDTASKIEYAVQDEKHEPVVMVNTGHHESDDEKKK